MKLNLKSKKKKKEPPALKIWRDLPIHKDKTSKGVPIPLMTKMRGNPKASILLIAPPCDPEEYENGIPFSNNSALVFHELLSEYANIDSNTDCLVISCSRFGHKPNKASTAPIMEYVHLTLKLDQFKGYICVGDDAFKYTFGRGKKPSMATLAGNIMYLPETRHKPVFVFPNLDGLYINEDIPMHRRDAARAFDWRDKVQLRFINLCETLKKTQIGKLING